MLVLDALKDTEGQRRVEGTRSSCPAKCDVINRLFAPVLFLTIKSGGQEKKTGFRKRNCILAQALNVFWQSPASSCNLCSSKGESLLS